MDDCCLHKVPFHSTLRDYNPRALPLPFSNDNGLKDRFVVTSGEAWRNPMRIHLKKGNLIAEFEHFIKFSEFAYGIPSILYL